MMGCSWSTVLNPCEMLRVLWEFAVISWRRFQVFWARLTTPEHAPTVDRIVVYQSQSTQSADTMRRQISLEAHHGSVSSNEDSILSELSPSLAFRIPETDSRISHNPFPGGLMYQGGGQM